MNSPKKINYELRPYKFTERKMLVAGIQRVLNYFGGDYQYIGMGGLSFTDFKIFHKELHINEMFSIEGGDFSKEKLEYNSPYSFIKILKSFSTNALTSLDLSKRTFVWLDYDGTLDDFMFDDITILFSKLPVGSIYLMTCNRELKDSQTRTEYDTETFKEKFGNLIPFDITNQDFSSLKNQTTIRKMIYNHINGVLKDRRSLGDLIKFNQLFNITYQEHRGANMFSYGGVITSDDFNLDLLDLKPFEFINSGDSPYNIKIPNITKKEADLINDNFDDDEGLISMNIVREIEINKYKSTYKFLPNYLDVRQ